MKKALEITLGALLIALVAFSVSAVPQWLEGNQEAEQALQNNDYDAFVASLPTEGKGSRMAKHLDEEHFAKMVEGFNHREAVDAAIVAHDYDAYVAAVQDAPRGADILDVVTAENFDTFVAHHEAMESGDFETARALADEIGLEPKGNMGEGCMGHRQGFGPEDGEGFRQGMGQKGAGFRGRGLAGQTKE